MDILHLQCTQKTARLA